MGDVKLNSSGGGSVTLTPPNTASNYTVTLPAATSTLVDTTSTQTLTNKTLTAAGSNTVEATSGPTSTQLAGQRNKIINGAMMIDQRNAGASVSGIASASFVVDRWAYYTNATAGAFNAGQSLNSVTPPAGYTKYLGFQVASAQTPTGSNAYFFGQKIEGFNAADLAWGTVGAKTIAISFQVYSSLTGTFSGNVQNASNNRSYVFSFTVNSANTWEYKTVIIAGDTTGTWASDNSAGLIMYFNLGCGSGIATTAGSWNAAQYIGVTGGVSVVSNASATFYITGVQLEKGATATPFENRLYGTELALCQRYYEKYESNNGSMMGVSNSSTRIVCSLFTYKTSKRAVPTITITNAAKVTTPTILDYVGVWSGAIYGTQSDAGFVPTFNYVSGTSISAGLALGITGSLFYIDAEL